jgi:hypothetical protein
MKYIGLRTLNRKELKKLSTAELLQKAQDTKTHLRQTGDAWERIFSEVERRYDNDEITEKQFGRI